MGGLVIGVIIIACILFALLVLEEQDPDINVT